jgi:hypothetical protein
MVTVDAMLGRRTCHECGPRRKATAPGVRRRTAGATTRRRLRRRRLVAPVALVFSLGEAGDGRYAFALLETDQPHTLRVPADHANLVHAQPDDLSAARDEHDLVVVGHHPNADDPAGLLGRLHRDDALAAATGESVLVHLRPLSVPVLGDGEEGGARLHQVEGDDFVPLVELHAPDPVRVAPHQARLVFLEADRLAVPRGEDDLLRPVGEANADHLVAVFQGDGDDARRRGLAYCIRSVFFTRPRRVAKKQRPARWNSRTGRKAESFSSGFRLRQFVMLRPRAARPACGTSCTFSQYTLPVVVKIRMYECVEATKSARRSPRRASWRRSSRVRRGAGRGRGPRRSA